MNKPISSLAILAFALSAASLTGCEDNMFNDDMDQPQLEERPAEPTGGRGTSPANQPGITVDIEE